MVLDFNKPPFIYWSDVDRVSYLQRRIIVYSILYYEMNESIISDYDFDQLSNKLVSMQNELSVDKMDQTSYNYVMKEFDGSSGFYIMGKLTSDDLSHLTIIAESILRTWRTEKC